MRGTLSSVLVRSVLVQWCRVINTAAVLRLFYYSVCSWNSPYASISAQYVFLFWVSLSGCVCVCVCKSRTSGCCSFSRPSRRHTRACFQTHKCWHAHMLTCTVCPFFATAKELRQLNLNVVSFFLSFLLSFFFSLSLPLFLNLSWLLFSLVFSPPSLSLPLAYKL